VSDEELYRCGECGKKYCEEVYEAEEDYWGWK